MTTDTETLLALAERCEQASAEDQYDLIGDTWDAIGPRSRPSPALSGAFGAMLDASAFESAALLLIPAGGAWRKLTDPSASVYARSPYGQEAKRYDGNAATFGLQICAAVLRLYADIAAKEDRALAGRVE